MTATGQREQAARARFGARATLAMVAIFVAAVPVAILVALVREASPGLSHLDRGVAENLHRFAVDHSGFSTAMKTISALGSPVAWWIVLTPVFGWLLYRRLTRLAAFVAVSTLGSSLLNRAIKLAVDRARPRLSDPIASAAGKSFPSGHTQAAFVGCGVLVLVFLPIVRRRVRPWLIVAASVIVLLIGFSRVALGVHYFSDVVGAILIGLAWLLATTAAFSAWRRDEHKPPVRITEGLEPEQRARILPGPPTTGPPT